jgi:DNA gyrase/topoisomerase IV subunit A
MEVTQLDIKDHVDVDFRDYSMYVIQSRGIPNFYDSLTPVQRFILLHAPDKFQTTVALVGHVMATGLYHHGDAGLTSAINKLARPFGNSRQLLLGDGFFGSPVNPKPASSRYTKIKIDPRTKEFISSYSALNKTNSDGVHEWLHLDVPLALCTHIVGIAVGYASNILPRKLEDVQAYLEGKPKKLLPHFEGFGGKLVKYPDRKGGWILEGVFSYDDDKMSMRIGELPPLVKYSSFIAKLNAKLDRYGGHYSMTNNTKKTADISIKWRSRAEWEDVKVAVSKLTKVAVIENLVFVKNGAVVEYDSVHDYLDEFRLHRERVVHMKMSYDLRVQQGELDFLRAKRLFLIFMMEKKRKSQEIKTFIDAYNHNIRRRLDSIKLTALSPETLKQVERDIEMLIAAIAEQERSVKTQLDKCKLLESEFKSTVKINMSSALFEEETPYQLDGIDVFQESEEVEVDEDSDIDEDEETEDETN